MKIYEGEESRRGGGGATVDRNPGELVVYIGQRTSKRVTEIARIIEEIIWVGVSEKINSKTEICMGFFYNAPQTSRWHNPKFTRELEKEIKVLSDRFLKTEFVMV
jgi:thymidylate kinase